MSPHTCPLSPEPAAVPGASLDVLVFPASSLYLPLLSLAHHKPGPSSQGTATFPFLGGFSQKWSISLLVEGYVDVLVMHSGTT